LSRYRKARGELPEAAAFTTHEPNSLTEGSVIQQAALVQLPWPYTSNSLENAVAVQYTGALYWLHPLVRIGTLRPVLFSGNALPMRAFAAYS
jgi:hypothetical protein